ncbi:MAG: flippase-like domain-containing protein [Bacteroidota bacterium]
MTKQQTYKLVAFLFGWGLLVIFLWQVDFSLVAKNLAEVGPAFAWIFVITGAAYMMAAAAWYLSFKELPKQLSITKLFVYRQIGETLTTVNPANIIVGETAKLYLLKQDGVDGKEGLASILLSRILVMLSMVALFLLIPFGLLQTGIGSTSILLPVMGLTVLISSFFYFLVSPKLWLCKAISFIYKRLKFSFIEKLVPKIKELNILLATYYQQQKGRLLLAFLLSLLHWIMGAIEIYFLLFLLDMKCTLFAAILIEVGVTCIKSLGAFIPGQIGVEEYGNKLMLELLNIGNAGLWVTISVLRRTRQAVWLVIGGLLFLVVYRKFKQEQPKLA